MDCQLIWDVGLFRKCNIWLTFLSLLPYSQKGGPPLTPISLNHKVTRKQVFTYDIHLVGQTHQRGLWPNYNFLKHITGHDTKFQGKGSSWFRQKIHFVDVSKLRQPKLCMKTHLVGDDCKPLLIKAGEDVTVPLGWDFVF